jgi:hypothetical protein
MLSPPTKVITGNAGTSSGSLLGNEPNTIEAIASALSKKMMHI